MKLSIYFYFVFFFAIIAFASVENETRYDKENALARSKRLGPAALAAIGFALSGVGIGVSLGIGIYQLSTDISKYVEKTLKDIDERTKRIDDTTINIEKTVNQILPKIGEVMVFLSSITINESKIIQQVMRNLTEEMRRNLTQVMGNLAEDVKETILNNLTKAVEDIKLHITNMTMRLEQKLTDELHKVLLELKITAYKINYKNQAVRLDLVQNAFDDYRRSFGNTAKTILKTECEHNNPSQMIIWIHSHIGGSMINGIIEKVNGSEIKFQRVAGVIIADAVRSALLEQICIAIRFNITEDSKQIINFAVARTSPQLHYILETIARAEHLVSTYTMKTVFTKLETKDRGYNYEITGPDGKNMRATVWAYDHQYVPCCFWEAGNSLTFDSVLHNNPTPFFVQWYPQNLFFDQTMCSFHRKWSAVLTAIARKVNCTDVTTPRLAYAKLSDTIKTTYNATNDALFSAISIVKINNASTWKYYPTLYFQSSPSQFRCDIWEIPTMCEMKIFATPPLPN